ncbi:MAG: crotonase/enoyl-CoA hydratase family protein [Rhodocyclaceae bacterium]|nr:crotonase/enoyl-CoA hydratase family protein [Rhodocyclaceae bacterium]
MTPTTLTYARDGRIARITLNRPDRLNAIDEAMPRELRAAVEEANRDDAVHVIVLGGAGRTFCAGYDLQVFAESPRPGPLSQDMPWDPTVDYRRMSDDTACFMSLWRSHKPVIARVQGAAIGGGTDMALCSDITIMADDAKIGYPPVRVWGCPQTAMWVYRLGAERAKLLLLTGDLIDGRTAAAMGLVARSVPAPELEATVETLAQRMAGIPRNHLMIQKMVINQAYDNMGLQTTQTMATLLDGITRHTPEGIHFKERCEQVGFKAAVLERDGGAPIGP